MGKNAFNDIGKSWLQRGRNLRRELLYKENGCKTPPSGEDELLGRRRAKEKKKSSLGREGRKLLSKKKRGKHRESVKRRKL